MGRIGGVEPDLASWTHLLPEDLTLPEAVAYARRGAGLRAVVLWVKDQHATCVAAIDDGSI